MSDRPKVLPKSPNASGRPDPVLPRIALGDANAVTVCLSRYGPMIYGLARRFHANSSDVDDSVQEIFIEIWKCANRYDPALSSESTFVTMIARRKLIDRYRRDARPPVMQRLSPEIAARSSSEENSVDIADEAAIARQALDQLREEQRQTLMLSVFHGLTHEEIAAETGMPIGTVKTHIRRGLMRVRELLDGRLSNGGGS